jgi:hypothetical protein
MRDHYVHLSCLVFASQFAVTNVASGNPTLNTYADLYLDTWIPSSVTSLRRVNLRANGGTLHLDSLSTGSFVEIQPLSLQNVQLQAANPATLKLRFVANGFGYCVLNSTSLAWVSVFDCTSLRLAVDGQSKMAVGQFTGGSGVTFNAEAGFVLNVTQKLQVLSSGTNMALWGSTTLYLDGPQVELNYGGLSSQLRIMERSRLIVTASSEVLFTSTNTNFNLDNTGGPAGTGSFRCYAALLILRKSE